MATVSSYASQHKSFYVYVLQYPDDYPYEEKSGTVFYVGKATLYENIPYKRIDQHEQEARKGADSYKCRVIRKIWDQGGQVVKRILADFGTNEDACLYEIALIFFMGSLTNRTLGGEGTLGLARTFSPQTLQKMSDAKRGRKQSPEHAMKSASARRGKQTPEETRRKISESHKGVKRSAEVRRRLSESNRGRKLSEDHRRKLSVAGRGRKQSPEHIRKKADALRGKHASEETRRKLSQVHTTKIYPGFVAPDGTRYDNVTNLIAFSRDHGLSSDHLYKVANGKQLHHKGWRLLS